MKYSFIIGLFFLHISGFAQISGAKDKIGLPRDLSTVEALIKIHKEKARHHDGTIALLEKEIETENKEKTYRTAFKKAYQTLNTKFETVNNYLSLVPNCLMLYGDFKSLKKNFTDFTRDLGHDVLHINKKDAKETGICTWYYFQCIYDCTREINFLLKQIKTIAGGQLISSAGINIELMTSKNLYEFISYLSACIDRCKRIIWDAYFYCKYVIKSGYTKYFMYEIKTSEFTHAVTNKIMSWCKK